MRIGFIFLLASPVVYFLVRYFTIEWCTQVPYSQCRIGIGYAGAAYIPVYVLVSFVLIGAGFILSSVLGARYRKARAVHVSNSKKTPLYSSETRLPRRLFILGAIGFIVSPVLLYLISGIATETCPPGSYWGGCNFNWVNTGALLAQHISFTVGIAAVTILFTSLILYLSLLLKKK